MVFNLNNFNDLGKCSYGTLFDVFDTNKQHIYLFTGKDLNDFVEIKITQLSDLFKFLWCIPCVSTDDSAYFHSTKEWWIVENEDTIKKFSKKQEYYLKKLKKETDTKKIEKIKNNLKFYDVQHIIDSNFNRNEMKLKNMLKIIGDNL